jgi:hypothetical protein
VLQRALPLDDVDLPVLRHLERDRLVELARRDEDDGGEAVVVRLAGGGRGDRVSRPSGLTAGAL